MAENLTKEQKEKEKHMKEKQIKEKKETEDMDTEYIEEDGDRDIVREQLAIKIIKGKPPPLNNTDHIPPPIDEDDDMEGIDLEPERRRREQMRQGNNS